jgi:hypothetical protein
MLDGASVIWQNFTDQSFDLFRDVRSCGLFGGRRVEMAMETYLAFCLK